MSAGRELRVLPVADLPEFAEGMSIGEEIAARAELADGDVVVVSQKVVSKAEGRVVPLSAAIPGAEARRLGAVLGKEPALVELILAESRAVLRAERGVLIVETHHGFVCANAGIDVSNAEPDTAILLPENPDASARALQSQLAAAFATHVGVIISDTFGRAWREGLVNVALGVAGIAPLIDYRGRTDANGKILQATIIAVADEMASAAELIMGKADRIPVAIVRGARLGTRSGSGEDLIRTADKDLFR